MFTFRNGNGAFAFKENTLNENIRYSLRNLGKKLTHVKEDINDDLPLNNLNAPEIFHTQDSTTESLSNLSNRKRSITKYDQDLIGNCTFTETRCRPLTAKRKIEFEPPDDANNPPKTVRIIRASAKSIARRLKASSLKKLALSAPESGFSIASNGSNCQPENYYQSCINDRLLTSNIKPGPVRIKVKRRKKRPESCGMMPAVISSKDRPESFGGILPAISNKDQTESCGRIPPIISNNSKTCDGTLSMQLNYSYTNLLNKFKTENSSSRFTLGGVSEKPSNPDQRKYFHEQTWQNSKDVYEFQEEDDAAILPQPPKIFSLSNKNEVNNEKSKNVDFTPEKYSRKLKLTLKVKKDYVLDLNIDGKVRVLEPQYEVLRLQAD